MDKEKLLYEDSVLDVYMRGYRNGREEATRRFCYGTPITKEELDELKEDNRQIRVVNGVVKVEQLDCDSEDYYEGYVEGLNAAYEVYALKKTNNCPVHLNCTCDRSAPCCTCDMLDDEDRYSASEEYEKGYDDGYFKGECGFFNRLDTDSEEFDDDIGCQICAAREKGYAMGFDEACAKFQKNSLEIDFDLAYAVYEIRNKIKEIQRYAHDEGDNPSPAACHMVLELYDVQKMLCDLVAEVTMDRLFDFWYSIDVQEGKA